MRTLLATLVIASLTGGCATAASPIPSATATAPATPTATAPASRLPTAVPSTFALGTWQPLPMVEAHTAAASGVLVTGDMVAVAGATALDTSPWHGAVWLGAADGTWQEIAGPSWTKVYLADLAAGSGGYVAAGTRIANETMDPVAGLHVAIEGSVWRSSDLRVWSEVGQLPGADPAWVLAGAGGWVVAGGSAPEGAGGCWRGCAPGVSVWWSVDGASWEPVIEEPDPAYRLAGIARSDATGWVAIARAAFEDDDRGTVALWRSADGRTWTRVDEPPGLAGVQVSGLAVTADGGFVAVANDYDFAFAGTASVFTSVDGVTWTAMPAGTPNLAGIAPLREGYIGWQNLFQDPGYGTWISADLETWTHVEAYPDFYAERMAGGGDRVLATAGQTQASALWSAAVTPSR